LLLFRQAPDQGFRDTLTRDNEVAHEPLVHVECPFVLSQVSDLVTLRQKAPDLWPEPKDVWNNLKDDVALTRPVTLPS